MTVHNRKEKTLKCLSQIYSMNIPEDVKLDVYMTDDGCTDGTPETVVVGATLTPGANGILEVTEAETGMLWQVVKVYTMPDHQRGVKIMRIQ